MNYHLFLHLGVACSQRVFHFSSPSPGETFPEDHLPLEGESRKEKEETQWEWIPVRLIRRRIESPLFSPSFPCLLSRSIEHIFLRKLNCTRPCKIECPYTFFPETTVDITEQSLSSMLPIYTHRWYKRGVIFVSNVLDPINRQVFRCSLKVKNKVISFILANFFSLPLNSFLPPWQRLLRLS